MYTIFKFGIENQQLYSIIHNKKNNVLLMLTLLQFSIVCVYLNLVELNNR